MNQYQICSHLILPDFHHQFIFISNFWMTDLNFDWLDVNFCVTSGNFIRAIK